VFLHSQVANDSKEQLLIVHRCTGRLGADAAQYECSENIFVPRSGQLSGKVWNVPEEQHLRASRRRPSAHRSGAMLPTVSSAVSSEQVINLGGNARSQA
jgi:hypothetical protein